MGAGKTTLGEEVAQRLGRPFRDVDAELERAHGPIADLFATGGEAAFRQLEAEAVADACGGREPSVIALGGGAVMALSYAILMPLMPDEDRGAVTGFYSASRGIGITIGPILAGALIAVLDVGPFASTDGYQVTWLVCAAAILLSIPFTRRLSAGGQPEGRDTG